MNYMWETLLEGEEHGIGRESIQFKPSRTANPYREVSFKDINKPLVSKNPIEVNAFYRYEAVFGALLNENTNDCVELREAIFDILAHYLSELDLRSGLCHDEYYARFLRKDIASELFTRENAQRIFYFGREQAQLVAAALLRMYKIGVSMRLFAQLLRKLYPNSIAYLDARDIRELLVYVGKKKTAELSAQMDFLCDLFVPVDYKIHLFWGMHFGLIGTDETMEIDNIMMY